MISRQQVEATERRFGRRETPREEARLKMDAGAMLAADSPDRALKRMAHLQEAILQTPQFRVAAALPPQDMSSELKSEISRAFERVLGKSDLMSILYLERGLQVARTVGRVEIRSSRGLEGYGTAFLVSPRLILTNHHVLPDARIAASSRMELDFQETAGGHSPSTFFAIDPDTFFLTDPNLDFTLAALRDPQGALKAYGWNRLIEDEGKAVISEYLTIIQHPQGELKQIALRENRLIDILDNFVHYRTDTAPGSSGSPVYNDQWEVVGLHHSGVPRKDADGNWLTRDGRIWSEDMREDLVDWIANEGARISRVVRHLKNQRLGASQARLRTECLETEPPASPPAPAVRRLASEEGGTGEPRPLQTVQPDGTVTWTIPVQISVRVGATAATGGDQDRPAPPAEAPAATPAAPEPVAGATAPEEPAELRQALALYEASRSRRYYDSRQDAEMAKAHYGDFKLPEDRREAYEALRELLAARHTEQPRYRPSAELYPWIDLQPNHKLRSIYSGLEFEPADFIREDFRIERERQRVAESLRAALPANEALLADLEAALPYNCEHVVPQSWFGKDEPMRGDLHHLFACESGCNSFRSNVPYFDFSEEEEKFRDKCGRRETGKFEPVDGKGAVARASLYFLVRYPGEIDATAAEYTADRIEILKAWHRAHPVTEYERHRNWAIHERQGNRNPFIDFPDWVERVDFTRGLGGAGVGADEGILRLAGGAELSWPTGAAPEAESLSPGLLLPGDVLLYRGSSWISWAIRFFDGSDVSHASLCLDGGAVVEAIGQGVVRRDLATSVQGAEWVRARRLYERPEDMAPVLRRAEVYLEGRERYAYEQVLLLAFLCLTRKPRITPVFNRLVRRALDSAASLLARLAAGGREPMICSELVYRAYDEAVAGGGDAYSLRIHAPVLGGGLEARSTAGPRGRGIHPDSVLARVAPSRSGSEETTFEGAAAIERFKPSAPDVPPVDEAELSALIQEYLREVQQAESLESAARLTEDEELARAVDRFAVGLHATRRGSSRGRGARKGAVERAETASRSQAYETLLRTAADFVTPGDLLRTESLYDLGRLERD